MKVNEVVSKKVVYHAAKQEDLASIVKHGLKTGMHPSSWADKVYKVRPIYVALKPMNKETNICLQIDATSLILYPDLPSLVDHSGQLGESYLWWEEDAEPEMLKSFLEPEEGILYYDKLMNDAKLIEASIQLTQTAAVLTDIPVHLITLAQ